MVIDENNTDQINTALITMQRKLERLITACSTFTTEFQSALASYESAMSACTTVDEIKAISLEAFENLTLKI